MANNDLPKTSIFDRGSNLPGVSGSRPRIKTSAFDKIDTEKIGSGRYFAEGSFGNRRNIGLKGQLSSVRRAGWSSGVTQNLSTKNLKSIYGILSERLKKHATQSNINISRKDKQVMMGEAEKLIHTKGSDFTREDKKDLESIVDTLKRSGRKR